MYNAPSVSYPVGRCAFLGLWLTLAGCLAVVLQAGAWLGWWPTGAWVVWRWWTATAVWLLALGVAWWQWLNMPQGWLTWEPLQDVPDQEAAMATWWWSALSATQAEALTHVQCMWLTQRWGLLKIHRRDAGVGQSTCEWVCVTAALEPRRWLALRRALTSHAA